MQTLLFGLFVVAGTIVPLDHAVAGNPASPQNQPSPGAKARASLPLPLRLVSQFRSAEDLKAKVEPAGTVRLVRPFGVTLDDKGRIYAADPGNRGVLVFDRRAGVARHWQGNSQNPLEGPVAVGLDRAGRLFVVDAYRSRIVVFDSSGNPIATFGQELLGRPQGLAVDGRANLLYVSDFKLHQVLIFDLNSLALRQTIGSRLHKHFTSPASLAVNSKGQLVVSDASDCRVQIFDAQGEPVHLLPPHCPRKERAGHWHAVAVDAQDLIYVSDPEGSAIHIFDPTGKPLQVVTASGDRAEPSAFRTGLTIDREARIYVVDQESGQGRVQIFAPRATSRRRTSEAAQFTNGPRP